MSTGTSLALRVVQFLTLVLTALALIPVGAHIFELPNKIGLAKEEYFVVQGIYRGWALFGVVLFTAVAMTILMTILSRSSRLSFWLAFAAFLCLAGSTAIFFIWTYPANVTTRNWTFTPDNWQAWRLQWEYSHAANAIVTFAAFCSAVLSVIAGCNS